MSESEAKRAWMKANTTKVSLKLNNKTDAEIIKRLSQQESMQGYIKELIRKDIAENPTK